MFDKCSEFLAQHGYEHNIAFRLPMKYLKKIIVLVALCSIAAADMSAQTSGLTFGQQFQWIYSNSPVARVSRSYTVGYQQTIMRKVCMGLVYHFPAFMNFRSQESTVKTTSNDYITYFNYNLNFNGIVLESRYFFNDYEEAPMGVYLGSCLPYSWFSSSNTISSIRDQSGGYLDHRS